MARYNAVGWAQARQGAAPFRCKEQSFCGYRRANAGCKNMTGGTVICPSQILPEYWNQKIYPGRRIVSDELWLLDSLLARCG